MALRFVASGGSNTSPYETWAKAATSLQTALTGSANGDIIVIQYNAVPSGDAELAADVTYTFGNNTQIISASNDGTNAYTPTAMGTANWIGNSTTNRSVTFTAPDFKCFVYGLTIRTAGTTGDKISLATGAGQHTEYESCYFWQGTSASGGSAGLISLSNNSSAYVKLVNCTLRFGATTQYCDIFGHTDMVGCSISSSGSSPALLVSPITSAGQLHCTGCDFQLVTTTLVPNSGTIFDATFDRCRFASGVTVLAAQTTNPSRGSASVLVSDCHDGDTHMEFGYYDALGEVTKNGTIYFTSGAATASWKIVTSANTKPNIPFTTPWIDLYNTGTSAITPRFEILRDGSATAYQNDEVWAEFSAKTSTGFTNATAYNDRVAVAGTAADQTTGAGTGSWTGENATAWSGKCDSGASLTPAEVGYIRGRICVAEPSITVYVNPEILTA